MLLTAIIAGSLVGTLLASRSWMRSASATRGGYVDKALAPGVLIGAFCGMLAAIPLALLF